MTYSGHSLSQWEGHAWRAASSSAFLPQRYYKRTFDPVPSSSVPLPKTQIPTPSTHPATPDHCPLALQPTCLDSSSSVRSGGRPRLKLGSGRHMEMAVERTRAICPHTHTGHTSGGRQRCLSMHKAGTWAVHPGCWGLGEATRPDAKSRASAGCGGFFSAVPLTTAYTIAKHK